MKGKVYVGCSGFSYKDWRGTFYPSSLDQSEFITYYERFFEVLEVNYTFYTMPHRHTFEGFLEKTRRLKFSVKANRIFTHERSYSERDLDRFLEGISPVLKEERRFVSLLFQFPQSFNLSRENMDYLGRLSVAFAGIDKAVELRNRGWGRPEALEELEGLGFTVVNLDAPKVEGLLVGPWRSVGSFNYLRLHGRNKEKWHEHEEAYERYDYLYSEAELKEIKEKILRIQEGKDTYVFFNNHFGGKGALNALQFKRMLGEEVDVPKGLRSAFSGRLWE